jgi:lantibiotic modifying enzyme
VNRCFEKSSISYKDCEERLPALVEKIEALTIKEQRLDFLLGISGIASAILPYVRRTSNKAGISVLKHILSRLQTAAKQITLANDKPIEGMDYLRGLSHGITGIALSLYRLGEFFGSAESIEASLELVLHEYKLTENGNWTDHHMHNEVPLVGWCHGSAGIALGLSLMPKIFNHDRRINSYLRSAISNTKTHGRYDSKCLCHGSFGNALCINFTGSRLTESKYFHDLNINDYLQSGFLSFGAAQSMGVGLMTGLSGAGIYLLGRNMKELADYGFLSLS